MKKKKFLENETVKMVLLIIFGVFAVYGLVLDFLGDKMPEPARTISYFVIGFYFLFVAVYFGVKEKKLKDKKSIK